MMEKKYISVDQLWKCETCFYMGSNGKCRSDCDTVESYRPAYSKFKFADVAPVVHGEWIEEKYPFCNVCPHCGVVIDRTCIKMQSGALNYCPNCGAKMDGGK